MRVLVLRADGESPNFGVRALADGTVNLLRTAYGEDCQVEFQNYNGGVLGMHFDGKSIIKEFLTPRSKVVRALSEYDLVLDACGGDSFTDIYGKRRLLLVALTHGLLYRARVPAVLGPQTIGPFRALAGRTMARWVLRTVRAVFARDKLSAECASALGREVDAVVSDVVFLLDAPEQFYPCDVVFNVSGLLWNPNTHVNYLDYRESAFEFCREMVIRGRSVKVLPHVVRGIAGDDDLSAAHSLIERLGAESVQLALPGGLHEARSYLGGANVVVAARMHACLNALSLGVPAIPWAYSRKFAPLLQETGWDEIVDLRSDTDAVARTVELVEPDALRRLTQQAQSVSARGRASLGPAVAELRHIWDEV